MGDLHRLPCRQMHRSDTEIPGDICDAAKLAGGDYSTGDTQADGAETGVPLENDPSPLLEDSRLLRSGRHRTPVQASGNSGLQEYPGESLQPERGHGTG